MLTARDIAFRTLLKWQRLDEPPFVPERTDEDWKGLPPRDRAFAFDLLTGILRWRNTLDAVIASRLKQPLESLDHPVRVVLWVGAYQLLMQSGTTDYAAVDTTVTLAKRNPSTAKASGLVNAVLRGITRLNPTAVPRNKDAAPTARLSRNSFALDFETRIDLQSPVFPDPATFSEAHLAAVRSHPALYVHHLRKIYGPERTAELLLRNNVRPLITLRADADAIGVPAAAGLEAHPDSPRFLIARAGWNPAVEQLVQAGTLSPQDPTAAKPVRHLRAMTETGTLPSPGKILDLCAGLGTKTVQLARAFPSAEVTATDVDASKLDRLKQRIQQVGIRNVVITPLPPPPPLAETTESGGQAGTFDLVLLDVPCSNTGVMAKRVQSRWRWPTLNHDALHALQHQLLSQGVRFARNGGTVVYSTCSIDPAENETLVSAFVAVAGGRVRLLHQETTLPSLDDTSRAPHDGGYFALLGISHHNS